MKHITFDPLSNTYCKTELQALLERGKGKFVQPQLYSLVHVDNDRSLHSTMALVKDWVACMSVEEAQESSGFAYYSDLVQHIKAHR